jgi:hypothetical protein|tara:strand:- start:236 stop:550 length:315 start_codon:yes stop_codon:yes gene_type:complete
MIHVSDSSAEKARKLVLLAFNSKSSKRKSSLRVFKNILSLAEQRGYKDSNGIISHLKSLFGAYSNNGFKMEKLDKITERYINDLYEFVSSDEILQLSKVVTFGD